MRSCSDSNLCDGMVRYAVSQVDLGFDEYSCVGVLENSYIKQVQEARAKYELYMGNCEEKICIEAGIERDDIDLQY